MSAVSSATDKSNTLLLLLLLLFEPSSSEFMWLNKLCLLNLLTLRRTTRHIYVVRTEVSPFGQFLQTCAVC